MSVAAQPGGGWGGGVGKLCQPDSGASAELCRQSKTSD